jgi:hypothetical protein
VRKRDPTNDISDVGSLDLSGISHDIGMNLRKDQTSSQFTLNLPEDSYAADGIITFHCYSLNIYELNVCFILFTYTNVLEYSGAETNESSSDEVFFPDSPEITISRLSQLKPNTKKKIFQTIEDDDNLSKREYQRKEEMHSSSDSITLPYSSYNSKYEINLNFLNDINDSLGLPLLPFLDQFQFPLVFRLLRLKGKEGTLSFKIKSLSMLTLREQSDYQKTPSSGRDTPTRDPTNTPTRDPTRRSTSPTNNTPTRDPTRRSTSPINNRKLREERASERDTIFYQSNNSWSSSDPNFNINSNNTNNTNNSNTNINKNKSRGINKERINILDVSVRPESISKGLMQAIGSSC